MPVFHLTIKALEDMKDIGQFTEKNWGRDQRNRYLKMLDACFHAVGQHPGVGIDCSYIREGYRKYHAGRHLIFYRKVGKDIEIVRILHDSMDVERHF